MDSKSLSHVKWKCQISEADFYHYSIHFQVLEEGIVWSGKSGCA